MPRNSGRFRIRRVVALGVIGCVLAVLLPYTWARIHSDANAVSTATIDLAPRIAPHARQTLRVGCFNIAHGRGGTEGTSNWDGGTASEQSARIDEIGEFIASHDLDIVVLNEVDFDAAWSHGVDQAVQIATVTGHPFLATQRNIDVLLPFATLRFGNAILSRFPIDSARRIALPPVSRLARALGGAHDAMIVRLDLGEGRKLDVVAVHLESRSRPARIESAARLTPLLTSSEVPVLLMGDFNSEFGKPGHADPTAIERLVELGRHQLIPDPASAPGTFPSAEPTRTIDWILAPREWIAVGDQVIASDLSDHLPVIAEFDIDGIGDDPDAGDPESPASQPSPGD